VLLGTAGAIVYGAVLAGALNFYGIGVPLPRRLRRGMTPRRAEENAESY
jgi:hypothetical protein